MTDEAALLVAVLEHPADDTPRLIYADWCDENDEPHRAEFIRVQVELSKRELVVPTGDVPTHRCAGCGVFWTIRPDGSRHRIGSTWWGECCNEQLAKISGDDIGLLKREHALLSAFGPEWARAVVPGAQLGDWSLREPQPHFVAAGSWFASIEFRRGFVEFVACLFDPWHTHGASVLARHPVAQVSLPHFRVEIVPPRPKHGWELYYTNRTEGDFGESLGIATRGDMIARLMSDVRAIQAMFE